MEYERGLHCERRTDCWVSFFKHSSNALVVTDQTLEIKQLNPKGQRLLEGTMTNGTLFSKRQFAQVSQQVSELVHTTMASPQAIAETEVTFDDKVLSVECQPLVSRGAYLLTLRDITVQKQQQQRLEQQNKLVCLGATAAGIAHELTSPLAALATEIEMIRMAQTTEPDKLQTCEKLIQRMQLILRELAGTYANAGLDDSSPIKISDAIGKTVRLLRFNPHFQNTRLKQELHDNVPQIQMAERHLLLVLLNILDNAFKACNGDIGSEVTLCVTSEQATGVCISITDNGPGLSNHSSTSYSNGLGIGLSISRHIVTSYGGQLELLNNGQGTTANLRLPTQCCRSPGDSPRGDLL